MDDGVDIVDVEGAGAKPRALVRRADLEARYFPLDTPTNCVECIAAATWSFMEGYMSHREAKLVIDAASRAAKIVQDSEALSQSESILKDLARTAAADGGVEVSAPRDLTDMLREETFVA